jgi:uncharacterized membrane protein YgcG
MATSYWKALVLCGLSAVLLGSAPAAPAAQISVDIGAAPYCPYGYFDYTPYDCAPYGYYGPDWFTGGIFVGAGPWFHGSRGFYGHVDNRYDPRHGYHGPFPSRGATAFNHFQGNEARDGRGHTGNAGHDAGSEHSGGFSGGGHAGGGGSRGGGHR